MHQRESQSSDNARSIQLGFSKNSLNMNCGSLMSQIPAPHKYGLAPGSLFYHASNYTARLGANTEVTRDNAGFRAILVIFKLVAFREEALEIQIMFWESSNETIFSSAIIAANGEAIRKSMLQEN